MAPTNRRRDAARLIPVVAVLTAAAGMVHAAPYQFALDARQSTLSSSATLSTPVTGTLIGNYDAVTNPTGTRTLPGIAGGSGNQPIPYTATLGGDGDFQSHPDGEFTLNVNPSAGTASLSNLALDLLAGATPSFPATFTINYQTFHTVAPSSLFIGGIPIPLPLGNVDLTALTLTQVPGSAVGTLKPTGPNQYSLSVTFMADLVVEGALGGQTSPSGPSTISVTLTGALTLSPGGLASMTSTIQWSIDETDPVKVNPIKSVPFDVPTIIPSGSTAHLLLSGSTTSITTQLTLNATLISGGVLNLPADLNGDGHVNGLDLALLLGQWGPCPKVGPCSADLNADGHVNGLDLAVLLGSWG